MIRGWIWLPDVNQTESSLARMLSQLKHRWYRAIVAFATILAILLSPLPLSPLNITFTASHLVDVVGDDHDHVKQRTASQVAEGGAEHRPGHNPTDHSHDVPSGILDASASATASRQTWPFAFASSAVLDYPFSIERPPRINPIA